MLCRIGCNDKDNLVFASDLRGRAQLSPCTFSSMLLSPYCIQFDHPESPDQVVLFSSRTGATVTLSRDVLRDIERNVLASDEQASLVDLGFLVTNTDAEKREMLAYIDQMNAQSTSLRPIVVLNLDCNLACTYCFEGTRKGKHFLSRETADDLVGFIDQQLIGKNEIIPTFYGGEPLLSTDMIAYISEQLRELSDARGAAYEFRMITNGTLLTRRAAERLKSLGLRSVNVTLDGPREIHDSFRPFRSGTGSFDTIVRNLHDVCGLIDVHVGGNYLQGNYQEFPRMLDHLTESGLGPDRISSVEFSPVFQESREFVPDFHGGCATTNEPWIAQAGAFLRQEILSRGFRNSDIEPTVCMVERFDRYVVNWDGDLYKCPNFLGRKEFCIGTLRSGRRAYNESHDLGNWKNDRCLGCCYLPLCFGGCRYFRHLRQGTMQGVDCRKEYFDMALRPLVMQDVLREQAAG